MVPGVGALPAPGIALGARHAEITSDLVLNAIIAGLTRSFPFPIAALGLIRAGSALLRSGSPRRFLFPLAFPLPVLSRRVEVADAIRVPAPHRTLFKVSFQDIRAREIVTAQATRVRAGASMAQHVAFEMLRVLIQLSAEVAGKLPVLVRRRIYAEPDAIYFFAGTRGGAALAILAARRRR